MHDALVHAQLNVQRSHSRLKGLAQSLKQTHPHALAFRLAAFNKRPQLFVVADQNELFGHHNWAQTQRLHALGGLVHDAPVPIHLLQLKRSAGLKGGEEHTALLHEIVVILLVIEVLVVLD